MDFLERCRLSDKLGRAVVLLRRQALGLSPDDVSARAKRKGVSAHKLLKYEAGHLSGCIRRNDEFHLEKALELPPGALDKVRKIVHESADSSLLTADQILERLIAPSSAAIPVSQSNIIKVCPKCVKRVNWLISYQGLALVPAVSDSSACICEGRIEGDTDLLFRIALRLASVRSVLILGGSAAIAKAARTIRFATVRVVLGKSSGEDAVAVVKNAEIVVIAGGEVSHAATQKYVNAIKSLPEAKRPRILRPQSSNLTAIACSILLDD